MVLHIGQHAESNPDKPAIIMGGSGETLTFGELNERSIQLSQLFRALGLQPGDHIAFSLENSPRFHEVVWGCLLYTSPSPRD